MSNREKTSGGDYSSIKSLSVSKGTNITIFFNFFFSNFI